MIDFTEPGFLQDPYPALNAAREETPIFLAEREEGQAPLWMLTRHEDVNKTLRDRRLGRVFDHVMSHDDVGMAPPAAHVQPFTDVEQWSLLNLEPPEHTRIRSLLSREFTPKRVAGLQPRMEEIVTDLLSGTEPGRMELLSEFAQPFSLLVMCELLGAPFEDADLLLDWSHRIVKMYELHTTPEQTASAVSAAEEFRVWTLEVMAARRAHPTDDLISGLCHVETEDGRLTDDEIISTVILLLNAGHEATVNTLGNGITAILQHPDQWALLTAGEVSGRTAAEEMFRFDSSNQLFERWVLVDDFEVAGTPIPKGHKVGMLFGAANRDPRKWERPDELDLTRGDPTHVTFGWGLHHCIGAPLARLEIATAVDQLAKHHPGLTLKAQPKRHMAFVIHGYESVELALT